MKTKKMSLANIQGKLSRPEMKKIMAGSGPGCGSYGDSCGGVGNGCCQGYACVDPPGFGAGNCVPCAEPPYPCD